MLETRPLAVSHSSAPPILMAPKITEIDAPRPVF